MALSGATFDKQGVDLHELARPGRLEALRQAPGVALSDEAEAAPARLAPEHGHRRDAAALHEHGEDAPDGRDRDGDPLSAQQHGDLALAPHRIIGAQPLDGTVRNLVCEAIVTPTEGIHPARAAVRSEG